MRRFARMRLAGPAFALVAAFAAPALAIPRPDLDLSAGTTFAATGEPSGGGASVAVSPMWPVAERLRFGASVFADDIGTTVVELLDRNDGTPLGRNAEDHRWTYGALWRGDVDLWSAGRWAAAAQGGWGYWRVEDDHRGTTVRAASALGFVLALEARRALTPTHALGLVVRYHRLSNDEQTAYPRIERYASAALQWRWAAERRP